MSRGGLHLTEQEFNALLATRATRALKAPEIQLGEQMAKAKPVRRAPSRLENELAGNLNVMGIAFETEYRFHPERKWRLDFAFKHAKLGVEIQGGIFRVEQGKEAGRHSRGTGQMKDFEKLNAAVELGWRILLFGPPHITTGAAALQIARILGV